MSSVPPDVLAWRRRTGADRFDEMWEGVLHMVASPSFEHQNLEGALEHWLRTHWAPRRNAVVAHQMNVARPGGWPKDYRIPDLVLLTPERFAINKNDYLEGGPDVVVEIRSPEDETTEKLPFYAEIGVREIWIIDRDTKAVEIHEVPAAEGGRAAPRPAEPSGCWRSPATGIEMRPAAPGKLAIRLAADDTTREEIPSA